jgi:hypothetical protein
VKARQCAGIAFVVLDQPSASCGPCEGAFYNPAPGQQHEAAFCFRQSDDLECNAVFSCGFGWLFSRISLIDVSQRDTFAGRLLDGVGKTADLGSIVGIGRRDVQGQQMSQCVHGQMQFRTALAFGAIID